MRVLITGGARGLGAALANSLSMFHEVIVWDREPLKPGESGLASGYLCLDLTPTVRFPKEPSAFRPGLSFAQVDLNDEAAVQSQWQLLPQKPTVLVNNAWTNRLAWLHQCDMDAWREAFGPLQGAYQLTCLMSSFWGGVAADELGPRDVRIVNISSVAARISMRATGPYCAAKAALDRLTGVSARELASLGIAVFGLAPGRIDHGTRMGRQLDAMLPSVRGMSCDMMRAYEFSTFPLGRRVQMSEVVKAAIWLMTDAPIACTGTILDVAGAQGA